MDENNSQFKEEFKLLLEKTIFPEDINEEERSRKWSEIINYIIPHIPKKLYRFRAYNENNVNSLKDETISLIRPDLFPDIYDSLIYVDTKKIDSLIKEALDPNSISAFINHCREKKEVPPLFADIFNDAICQALLKHVLSLSNKDAEETLKNIINQDITTIIDFIGNNIALTEKLIKNNPLTKIACFTEDICSKAMWDRYADGYKGFAIEYDFSNYVFSICGQCDKKICPDRVHSYLFPVIYSDFRYDATEIVYYHSTLDMSSRTKSQNKIPFPDSLFWIKAFLYKDKSTYSHEKEWRFMCTCQGRMQEKFLELTGKKPTAIYYGTYLPANEKEKLRSIAKDKNIKEYEMYVDNNTASYSLNYREIKFD